MGCRTHKSKTRALSRFPPLVGKKSSSLAEHVRAGGPPLKSSREHSHESARRPLQYISDAGIYKKVAKRLSCIKRVMRLEYQISNTTSGSFTDKRDTKKNLRSVRCEKRR